MEKVTKEKIQLLVDKYERVKSTGKLKSYTEEETKKDFILPLFEVLGWDTQNKEEVSAEESIKSSGRVDYGFYLNGNAKFYLEAKKLGSDLHKEEFANQAVKYSFNKGVTWAILTDFESLKIFNAQDIEKSLSDKLFFEITYDQYISRLDQLSLLSKKAFLGNLLDKEGEKVGKKLQKISVSETLYKDLNESREILTKALSTWNPGLKEDLRDEGVQKLLNRLVFLRVAEDRGVEPPTLIPMIRKWEAEGQKTHLYQSMVEKFREFDRVYNSDLFTSHPFEQWEEYSGATEKVFNILRGKKGYYEYDFKIIPADVLGSVYENYLSYKLAQSGKDISLGKDARKRKEHGIYYTPDYIVNYIVQNSLGPILDKCKSIHDLKQIKVLDPACGSGSFLVKALEIISDKYKDFGARDNVYTKLQILIENLYGVDLDEQAVEIARLNLLISALDKREKLPSLDKNIKNGNSLISGTDEELKKYFGKNYRDKKPFNWDEEFPEVFNRDNPGFNVIIGNPPYGVSFDRSEKTYLEKLDPDVPDYEIYVYFISMALELLRDDGVLGYIFPNTFLVNLYGRRYRKKLINNFQILTVVDLSDAEVFGGVSVRTCIMIIRNTKTKDATIFLKSKMGQFNDELKSVYPWIELDNNIGNWLNLAYISNVDQKILDKIKRPTIVLGKYFEVSQGLIPYDKYRGHDDSTIKNRIWHSDHKKDKTFRKELKGGDVQKSVIKWNGKTWISYGSWLAAPRARKYFINPRVLIREITDENGLIAAYTDEEYYNTPSIINVIHSSNNTISLKAILAVLNSKMVAWYHRNNSPKARKGIFPKVLVDDIRNLKIGEEFLSYKEKLGAIEDKQLNFYKKLESLVKGSNKWHSTKLEIEKTDHKIDQLVYKLYDLTPEEIAIVEGEKRLNYQDQN